MSKTRAMAYGAVALLVGLFLQHPWHDSEQFITDVLIYAMAGALLGLGALAILKRRRT